MSATSTSKVSSPSGAKETVLLRKPAPKYGFTGRKLPKEPVNSSTPTQPPASTPQVISSSHLPLPSNASTKPQQERPVAVVGASFHSHASSVADFRAKGEYPGMTLDHQDPQSLSSSSSTPNLLFTGQAEADAAVSASQSNKNSSKLSQSTQQTLPGTAQSQYLSEQNTSPNASTTEENQAESEGDKTLSSGPSLGEQLQAVREERDKLKTELNAQLQVNTELKRLLVASVGDDLYERVENLCRDRAQLELDIGGFSKKMSEDYENLDKISIQADMWRSKYLASRVMTEELSSAKAYLSLQCHDSHTALQQLLNERQELRTNLVESYKILQQVKNAFDPLNTHRSSSLRSTSVLRLSQACQQLSEAVRFRLLPANVVINVSADVSFEAWQDSVTRAERFAQEVLSRPLEVSATNSSQDQQQTVSGSAGLHTRYHPATRYENITVCCTRCRGEILVV
ncbi:Golgin-45 [Elysia marginata]|uniref:Golgin-45 n=1 Tax=Elysia marginata TaxID=1093978 RepID=A0AAV4GST8_9GAST|nr:Golgin-45 [Elysia marginata]